MTVRRIVRNGAVAIDTIDEGQGPVVVMLASLGRGAEDFDDLAARVVAAGFRVLRPQPRGIGASSPAGEGASLDDLSSDVAAVIAEAGGSTIVVGHAFGNRLARNTALRYPEGVSALALLACGGQAPIAPGALADLIACFDLSLPAEAHMAHVRRAFFAPGNDATVWAGGWYPETATMQSAAVRASDHHAWNLGGGQPMLVVQALQDVIAPPPLAETLKASAPDRIRIVAVENAGHAMLPEQPSAIAGAVIDFLNERRSQDRDAG